MRLDGVGGEARLLYVHPLEFIGSSTQQVEFGAFEYPLLQETAEFCGIHDVSMTENLLANVLIQSTGHGFRQGSHGGDKAREQARVKTEAAAGGARKTSLYAGLGMRHGIIHEIHGTRPSVTAALYPKHGIHSNSTSNVEGP